MSSIISADFNKFLEMIDEQHGKHKMKIKFLNINIDNFTRNDLLSELSAGVVFTPNVDHLVKLQKDKDFYCSYQIADVVLCDSKIVQWASEFLGTPIKEKISGSDLFPAFYLYHKDNKDIKIFLLGAAEGVAQKAAENINNKVSRNIVVNYNSPSFGFEKNENECLRIVHQINESGATVLAVGVGTPKQEKWIAKYKNKMPNIKIILAIGATIDFEAGNVKRANRWVSEKGLEWLYRLISEPKRLWKRYLVDDIPFLWLIFKQKIGTYQNPFENFKQ